MSHGACASSAASLVAPTHAIRWASHAPVRSAACCAAQTTPHASRCTVCFAAHGTRLRRKHERRDAATCPQRPGHSCWSTPSTRLSGAGGGREAHAAPHAAPASTNAMLQRRTQRTMLQRTQMLKPGEKRVSDNGKWRLEVLQTGEVTVRRASKQKRVGVRGVAARRGVVGVRRATPQWSGVRPRGRWPSGTKGWGEGWGSPLGCPHSASLRG